MALIKDADRQRIADAIRKVEAHTQGELVCVVARASGSYRFLPLLWATLVALSVPAVVWLAGLWWTGNEIYFAQVAMFVFSAVLFGWTPVKMRLIPRRTQTQQAARLAREQFFAQRLHMTRERTGVLLFVSEAEHYVEILADEGINAKVAAGTWEGIVAGFVAHVKQHRTADGFVETIGACGKILGEQFPARRENPDELPNRLIEI
jgi:putative membrane protein